jgi:hypothetical protein
MTVTPLALSNIVDISVTVSPAAATANTFNQGLFIGPSTVIPSYGANARLQQFTNPAAVLAAGFSLSSPEYIAAQIYFDQTPQPQFMWIGRQDLTAIRTCLPDGRTVTDGAITATQSTLTSVTASFTSADDGLAIRVAGAGVAGADLVTTIVSVSGNVATLTASAGTTVTAAQTSVGIVGHGYAVGDAVDVVQMGGSNGVLTVLTVGEAGQVITLGTTTGNQGTGYTVANGLSTTTTGSGTGLEVNLTVIGETLLQAAAACRAANSTWYGLAVNNPTLADNLALAEWADPLWQSTRYYPWSGDLAIANGTASNLALQLQALKLRVLGVYSTTQSGLYPNNIYAAVALMGLEMGSNTGLANSFFTVAHKQLTGIAPEPITQTQYTNIINAGFNVYGNFAPYQWLEPGFMSNGAPSYLWLNLAMLVSNLQIDVMNVLGSLPANPQTNVGEHMLLQGANQAGAFMAAIGFLASAVWTGAQVTVGSTVITPGSSVIPLGYLALAASYATQSSGDRAAGKAMPIYFLVTTAGAVQSLVIGVSVVL